MMNYNPTEQRRREEIARRRKAVRQQTISSQIPVADPRKDLKQKPLAPQTLLPPKKKTQKPLSQAQKLRQRRTKKPKEESKATKQIRTLSLMG